MNVTGRVIKRKCLTLETKQSVHRCFLKHLGSTGCGNITSFSQNAIKLIFESDLTFFSTKDLLFYSFTFTIISKFFN
jgi:hypothetical protein